MPLQQLIQEIKEPIPDILDKSGSIVYSSKYSICKGDLYIMGLNPGGEPGGEDDKTIRETLDDLPSKTKNSYRDELWGNYKSSAVGVHPLQKNYVYLMNHLNNGGKEVFSSNLIFTRSRDASGANYDESAKKCWPVHEIFIKIIDPKCFIVFGNSSISPYSFIKNQYHLQDIGEVDSGHGNWKCKSCKGMINGKERLLIGIPHLSRYHINYKKEDVIKWIRDKINDFKN